LNAVLAVVCPVPPFAIAIVVPVQVPDVMVPTDVNELVTTVELSVVPLNVPDGAITALPDAAVISPLALTVNVGIDVDDPNVPISEFTVDRVSALPEVVASPVKTVR
jgi:hypothetical protein